MRAQGRAATCARSRRSKQTTVGQRRGVRQLSTAGTLNQIELEGTRGVANVCTNLAMGDNEWHTAVLHVARATGLLTMNPCMRARSGVFSGLHACINQCMWQAATSVWHGPRNGRRHPRSAEQRKNSAGQVRVFCCVHCGACLYACLCTCSGWRTSLARNACTARMMACNARTA